MTVQTPPIQVPHKRNNAIDSVKFIFSVIIVYFHLFYSNLKPYIGNTETFQTLAKSTNASGLIVECFLIIAGFFIYLTWKKGKTSLTAFTASRWIRLWPVFAFYTIVFGLQTKLHLENAILDLCFLRCSGLSLAYKGIIWYIGPFFWASLFIYALLTNLQRGKALLTIAILAYFSYAVNINIFNGGLGRETCLVFISSGMLRVIGGLCVGVILGAIKDTLTNNTKEPTLSAKWRFTLISIIEFLILNILLYHFLIEKLFKNSLTTIILFAIFFLCCVSSGGVVSRILNWKPLAYAGRWCYSIYVMQQIAFTFMAKAYWKSHMSLMQQYPEYTIAASTLVAVLIGIATYYLVEVPAVALYNRWKSHK